MAGIDTLPDYASEMMSFKRSDEARERLFADVLGRYGKLTEEHNALSNDYLNERDSRRTYQQEANRLASQLRTVDSNSFVLGLIDGDGVVFQDKLLAAGADGGSEAASNLHHAIQDHIAEIYGNAQQWPIMVQIYLSMDKLAQKLTHVGLLQRPQDFRAFAQSFNVNQPLFSIIDVGHGKERADYKIKEMLRTFSDNAACKHIVFGGCHDAGYLLNLDQYKHHQNRAARISLLESTPPHKGFQDLPNFNRACFEVVFKSEPLPDYAQPVYTQPQVSSPYTATSLPAAQLPARTTVSSPVQHHVKPSDREVPSPSTTASSVAGAQSDPSNPSWATVGKPVNGTVSIAPKSSAKKRYIYYNKDGQRLDEPLPPRDRTAAESIEKRMNNVGKNLCNHWHLNNGKCVNGAFCSFHHAPKLSPAEQNALRYKTRTLPCKNRQCQNFDCYLGHQCSFERDQGHCPFPTNCNLKATHGIDRVKYEAWDEDENVIYSK